MACMHFLLLLALGIAAVTSQSSSPSEIINGLLQKYDRSRPPRADQSTTVSVGMYINSFFGISSKDMEYSMSFYMRQSWQDPRLTFQDDMHTSIRFPPGSWDKLWTPDLFFRNEKDGKTIDILSPQRLLNVNATGHVWYVTKYTATLSCPMRLQKFPFDTQTCNIMFESFGYTADTLKFAWLASPVDLDKDITLPEFTLYDVILHDCSMNYTAGSFTCLEARFLLRRDSGHYILLVYIPTIIIVIISWIQFWLSPSAVTGRVLIGLFSLFTLIGKMTGMRASLPRVTYVTSLDVWMFACLIFTAASMIQLAVTQLFAAPAPAGKQKDEDENPEKKASSMVSRIDFVSRIVFPAVFMLFCIIYFSLMATKHE